MQLPWYVTALSAAIIWGVHYPLIDFAMKRLSIYSVLLIGVLPIVFLMPVFLRDVAKDVVVFRQLPTGEQWLILAVALTSTLGAVFLYLSVNCKNATLASLIEITYPLFVVLFAYLLFRQAHVNGSVIFGGLMILTGSMIVIYNNQ